MFPLEDATTLEAYINANYRGLNWNTCTDKGPVIPTGPAQSKANQGNGCGISNKNIVFGNSATCTNFVKYTGPPDIADRIVQIICIDLF